MEADRSANSSTAGRGTFVPLAFGPGEAFQFDWSEDSAPACRRAHEAAGRPFQALRTAGPSSLRAYLLQTHEMLFDAHTTPSPCCGGVPRRGIYDNMKTAVDRVGSGKAREVNARFLAMASHYLFEPEFCNPAAGWEKGQVEKNVQDARHRLWQPMPDFPTWQALNAWLEQRCIALWGETPHAALPGHDRRGLGRGAAALMPMPPAFDGFVEQSKRVSPTCLVHFERNRYSVPASFANRPVSLRIYPDRLVVAAEGQIVCEHPRIIQRCHQLRPHRLRLAPLPGRHPAQARGAAQWRALRRSCPRAFSACRSIC